MKPAALQVRNLSVWFENNSVRRQVVERVSFSIKQGEATGLVGESGCGKTIMTLAIFGLLPATGVHVESDGIELNGLDISSMNGRQRRAILGRDIAMIFQQPGTALDPVFTIGQQIGAVFRRHVNRDKKLARLAVMGSLKDVGFSHAEKIAASYPHELSGGMRQLAMIAMATVCKPAVIVADESTTALDSTTRTVILQQLKRIQALHQTAILLISHDLSIVKQNCHKVMVMYCGRLLEKADCGNLFSHPRHPYSAGLLACIPRICETRPDGIEAIPGQVPSASKLPQGCHFAPRCDRAERQCLESVPRLNPGTGDRVACHRPLS